MVFISRFFLLFLSLFFLSSCNAQAGDSLESRLVAKNDPFWSQRIQEKRKQVKKDLINTEYSLKERRLVGVMIENHRASRMGMQGLSQAKIVYEALAEGGITRFLALFPYDKKALTVGPVRSVRDYYLDWAEEYGIPLVHAGGSPTALERIQAGANILNQDESDDGTTMRDKHFQKPHNLFVHLDKVFEKDSKSQYANKREVFFTKKIQSLLLKNTGISINYWDPLYTVEYKFDSKTQKYLRLNGGKIHIDHLNNEQISVDNIIVQIVPYSLRVGDEKNRLDMLTKGSGKCIYLLKGTHQNCVWKYVNNRTQFLINDKEIHFFDGNVWVEVIDKESAVQLNGVPIVPSSGQATIPAKKLKSKK